MMISSRVTRFLLAFTAFAGLALICVPALATTYYVRTDGGTTAQCNGTANAPASAAPNCAWHSPMDALPPSGNGRTPNIKSGDTLVIEPGQFPVGLNSDTMAAYPDVCYTSFPWNCIMQPPPSGTTSQPTRIVGAGWDSGCAAPPQIYGVSGAYYTLDVGGASNVVVACLEITDHSACIDPYTPDPTIACSKSYPYGDWSETGVHAAGGSNVILQDLNIHGMANTGLWAGGMNNFTLRNVTIRANGYAGWMGDLGGGGNSSFSGTITLDHVNVSYNGCTEKYPSTTIYACWGQNNGGYGDGVGMAKTGGNWVITNSTFSYNTQDGLDLLYADGTGSVTIDRATAIGNAGNQLKASGTTTITNSVVVGNCDALAPFPHMAGDTCRAQGGALALEVAVPAQTVTLAYNTITGNGDCLIQAGTDIGVPLAATQVYQYYNNVFIGQPSAIPRDAGLNSCLDWYTDTSPNPETIRYVNNIVWQTRNTTCDGTGIICKDPQLVNETMAGFNPNLLSSSPAIGNASLSAYSVAWDYYGFPRSATGPIDIGAVAYRGQPYTGSGASDSPVPPPPKGGGTKSAGDLPAPVPAGPLDNKPVPYGSGLQPGAMRDHGLSAERYHRRGAPGFASTPQTVRASWPVPPSAAAPAMSVRATADQIAPDAEA
ncbi:MAG: right-handed parallel beta-helix repeat-containing protein, partial [Proteobacteria bacterium]|nr:right-handed parallel beta-helix repeat-containing protein [Pseudomonadota bacterium]